MVQVDICSMINRKKTAEGRKREREREKEREKERE